MAKTPNLRSAELPEVTSSSSTFSTTARVKAVSAGQR
jgi:hypothetical protein